MSVKFKRKHQWKISKHWKKGKETFTCIPTLIYMISCREVKGREIHKGISVACIKGERCKRLEEHKQRIFLNASHIHQSFIQGSTMKRKEEACIQGERDNKGELSFFP